MRTGNRNVGGHGHATSLQSREDSPAERGPRRERRVSRAALVLRSVVRRVQHAIRGERENLRLEVGTKGRHPKLGCQFQLCHSSSALTDQLLVSSHSGSPYSIHLKGKVSAPDGEGKRVPHEASHSRNLVFPIQLRTVDICLSFKTDKQMSGDCLNGWKQATGS